MATPKIKPRIYIQTQLHYSNSEMQGYLNEELKSLQDDENEIVSVDIKPTTQNNNYLSVITYKYPAS